MAFITAILGALAGLGKIVGVVWEGLKANFLIKVGKDAAAKAALEKKVELQDEYAEIVRRKPGDVDAIRERMRRRAERRP